MVIAMACTILSNYSKKWNIHIGLQFGLQKKKSLLNWWFKKKNWHKGFAPLYAIHTDISRPCTCPLLSVFTTFYRLQVLMTLRWLDYSMQELLGQLALKLFVIVTALAAIEDHFNNQFNWGFFFERVGGINEWNGYKQSIHWIYEKKTKKTRQAENAPK